ncbi:hypothetical protein J4Q44_G00000080 [Coregonus suidteri]|uniref:Uncharacterized protein n=1 Tax=Coregonus suidteri TaxID=861788 RepID=A0AAN8MP39_9TELE
MAQAASQIKKRAIVDTSVEDEKLKKRKIRQAQRQLKKKNVQFLFITDLCYSPVISLLRYTVTAHLIN